MLFPFSFMRTGGGFDPDAQAFFDRVTTAGGTLTTTEKNATNQLVLDMKSAGIWSAMKAVYPMVGASAAACAQNLKSSSFTGTFTSGWTFASTGITGNGTSAYMNTNLQANTNLTARNTSFGFYNRSNASTGKAAIDMSSNISGSWEIACDLISQYYGRAYASPTQALALNNGNINGFYILTSDTTTNLYRNGNTAVISSFSTTATLPTANVFLGGDPNIPTSTYASTNQYALCFIGDYLTSTQASNFYTAVQTFNQTLSRSVGPQIVSDADAQAYINRVYTAGGTLTNTEANAVNQLVIDMKAAGIWTAMKAVYPMVGSSAAACAQNLKSSSFTGTFTSGWTFSSTGVTGNGTSAYMDTNLNAFSNLTLNSTHLSIYCRTNQYPYSSAASQVGIGATNFNYIDLFDIETNGGTGNNNTFGTYQYDYTTGFLRTPNTDTRGFLIGNRPLSNSLQLWRNGSKIASNSSTAGTNIPNYNLYLSALNFMNTANNFASFENAFASIGDGLTDTQAADFYTCVNTFQVSLSRNV